MAYKFIELHDSDNEPILINPASIACVEKNVDEGCCVRLLVYGGKEFPYTKYVTESYDTIKNML